MQYVIKIEDGQPVGGIVSAENLRQVISGLPSGYLSSDILAGHGYAPFARTSPPPATAIAVSESDTPEPGPDGAWVETWQMVPRDLQGDALNEAQARHLASEKRQAKGAMIARIERFLSQLTRGVPLQEMVSWPAKAAEAKAYLAGEPSEMIEAEAVIRGVTGPQMAQIIAGKAALYSAIIYRTSGLRSATEVAIDASETPQQVWQAVESARLQAVAMAESLGLTFT